MGRARTRTSGYRALSSRQARLSSRGLLPGSIYPLAPALDDDWIPGTSPGMTMVGPNALGHRSRAALAVVE